MEENSKNQGTREKLVCSVRVWRCWAAAVVWVRAAPAGAAVVWAGCIDPRGARALSGGRGRRRAERTAECHPRSPQPAASQATAGHLLPTREPVATFDIQRATTLVQPQIIYLTGIALVLSLRNY